MFFADKAIFIEGETERILLPAMMRKIDQLEKGDVIPLLSQNISIVEVGAYSHIFERFIEFIGVKSLIITDIDSVKLVESRDKEGNVKKNKDGKVILVPRKCRVNGDRGTLTTNASLKFFYSKYIKELETMKEKTILQYFIDLEFNKKILTKMLKQTFGSKVILAK